jgi:hypothetical protein
LDVRDQWSNKVEYLLSVIGYVVDLGSKYNSLKFLNPKKVFAYLFIENK